MGIYMLFWIRVAPRKRHRAFSPCPVVPPSFCFCFMFFISFFSSVHTATCSMPRTHRKMRMASRRSPLLALLLPSLFWSSLLSWSLSVPTIWLTALTILSLLRESAVDLLV
ncbi:unnamed protein product [Fusarium graminearum]|nr:unnamed protein product [Fusarium graminearum]